MKYKIEKNTVQETLILPLYSRKLCTELYPNLYRDEEAYMIESLQRTERWREFFIKMSNDAFIFRNEVSDFAAVAFDSRQATVVRLKQLFNESGSTYTAINRYLEERRKKYG